MKTVTVEMLIFFNVLVILFSSVRGRASELRTQKSESQTITQTSRPNVLLIGIETLRADHLSCLGYDRRTTPAIDKLAKEGVLFTSAIATSSWTKPAVTSVFTSLYPGVHKNTDIETKLSEEITTLAQILKENGYVTTAFVSNPLLWHRYGFSKGFVLYDDFSVNLELSVGLFENKDDVSERFENTMTSEPLNRSALRWLRKNYDRPFFMFVFYFDPHYDYVPPPPFDTVFDPNYDGSIDGRCIKSEPRNSTRPPQRAIEHITALYDGEILYTDGYIAKLLEKFKEYGFIDNTFIIVFGDHGEEFYEHGSTTHGHTLYNELVHIPLIFRWPGAIPEGKKNGALVSQVDIMPTILDYLDIEYDGFIQGGSLKRLIDGEKQTLHDIVFAETSSSDENRFLAAAMSKACKFILDLKTGQKQFFNFVNDPGEQFNIYAKKASEAPVALEDHLTSYLANNSRLADRYRKKDDVQKVKLDEERIRKLKALGYIQ